jgi:pimeloyl-ACP methyl ester carboxylesterase
LFANIGFYFLAVNYRGVDGYGREYASYDSVEDAAKDVLAACEELLKDPQVDRENLLLCTISGGSDVIFKLLEMKPKLWRAAAFDKPTACPPGNMLKARALPPILIITGDQDAAYPSIKEFAGWAAENGVKVTTIVYTNSGHFTFVLSERKDKLDKMARFYLKSLK